MKEENSVKCVSCNKFYEGDEKGNIPRLMYNEEICKKCYKTGKFLTCKKCGEIYHIDNAGKDDSTVCFECEGRYGETTKTI